MSLSVIDFFTTSAGRGGRGKSESSKRGEQLSKKTYVSKMKSSTSNQEAHTASNRKFHQKRSVSVEAGTEADTPIAAKRTKANAGENEAHDIEAIIDGINSKNACGLRIVDTFKSRFPGCEILAARPRQGSNRGTHYDFEALVREQKGVERWVNIEHKGSYKHAAIKDDETPWSAGVQFHNGGCEKYSIAKKYARVWYDTFIASGVFASEFSLKKDKPTYEEWFKSDCKAQDNPKTEYGKELKAVVRAAHSDLLQKRNTVNDAMVLTDEDIQLLKREVLEIANQALEQKDYWLTIRGDLGGDFVCAWYPKFIIKDINEVVVTKKKDIHFEFRCNDAFVFHGILRWGKGAGFSNLRLDLK